MKYALIVRSNHLTGGLQALQFARALIAQQHSITGIYFLFDGAYVANKLIDMPSDELNLTAEWTKFAQLNNLDLLICAASGMRRGIVADNLAPGFKLGSIGQLVEACDQADQVVTL
jgi:tRNA 2-thiouridine synthesizing protein D